ncbi:uncharacterized protein SPPG_08973 [Spizellomyces punctatus DAOM BR117]|uniref:Uncharacterized protein n=1 Tax=Spizellomyces punctatus (strain DAOM BR117) TaxID=645134 RepID=A0A0L0HNE7_SPIPD|nr:uncharacterized protein SPPG_08973 [Spizellomyces punctatus DAOM BR117]KND02956.1 hypothetical protein SPPG_08973 [Spizellomyces punctatus DAOM BR117]|eukprot:XP_016610995.1 hypothetical protein SPPG_08973 [Spizellomyces punctatus DAOM BR117]
MSTDVQTIPLEPTPAEKQINNVDQRILTHATEQLNQLVKAYLEAYPADANDVATSPDPLKSQCYFL